MSHDMTLAPQGAKREESTADWIDRAQKAETERDGYRATAKEALSLLSLAYMHGLPEEAFMPVRAFVDRNRPATEGSSEDEDITSLLSRFASELRRKLISSEAKYGWQGAWKRDGWADNLRSDLLRHDDKGDPIDVAAYCAFAWHHGWSLAQPRRVED